MPQDPQTLTRLRAALAELRVDDMLAEVDRLRATAEPADLALLDAWTAVALMAGGRLDDAEAMARSSVGRAHVAQNRAALFAGRYAHVQVLLALGRLAEAREVLALTRADVDSHADPSFPRYPAQVELLAAQLALRAGDTTSAARHADEAARRSIDEGGIVRAEQVATTVRLARGDIEGALSLCVGLADRATAVGDRQAVVRVRLVESEARLRSGNPVAALEHAHLALSTIPDDGLPGLRGEAWNAVGQALRALGQFSAAADAHRRAEASPEAETRHAALAGLAICAFLDVDDPEASARANRLFTQTRPGTAHRDLATSIRLAVAARTGDRVVWDRIAGLLAVPLGDSSHREAWTILETAAVAWERRAGPGDLARAIRAVEGAVDRGGTGPVARLRARGAPLLAGRWDLERLLGQGGMAQVWLGSHHDHPQRAAIKLVTETVGRRRARIARLFDAEMRAAASLDHPNVVRVLDHGVTGAITAEATDGAIPVGTPWFAMPVVDSGSLVDRCGRLPWAEVRRTLTGVLAGLGHAHARGVLHLDVKPDNVLLGGEVTLTDFGLAGIVSLARGRSARVGTPQSMAPEQFVGNPTDYGPWTDLYGLGCLAISLVTGRPVFPGDTTGELERAHLHEEPVVTPVVPVPDGFDAWVRRLLAKDPGGRTPTAAHAAAALAELGEAPGASVPVRSTIESTASTVVLDGRSASAPVGHRVVVRSPPVPLPLEPPEPSSRPASLPGMVALRRSTWAGTADERRRGWAALREAYYGPVAVVAEGDGGGDFVVWLVENAEIHGGLRGLHGVAALERAVGADLGFPGGIEPIARRLEALCAERPVALGLEDGPATRALAERLLEGKAPVFVGLWGGGDAPSPRVRVVRCGRVSTGEVERHLDTLLPLTPELRAELGRRSAGSPPFATALLVDLAARDALEHDGARFGLRPGETVNPPDDVRALWIDRVDRALAPFSADARDLLIAVALLGPTVDRATFDALTAALLLDARRIERRLAAAALCTVDAADALVFDPTLCDVLVEGARSSDRLVRCAGLAASVSGMALGAERYGRLLLDAERPVHAAHPLAVAAEARLVAGDADGAVALLALRTRKLGAAGVGPESPVWIVDRTLGSRLALLAGRRAEAVTLADAAVSLAREHGGHSLLGPALQARAMATTPSVAAMLDLLEAGVLYAEQGDAESEADALVHLAVMRAPHEPEIAMAELARAAHLTESPLIRARARVARARLLSDPEDAARELALATEAFERIGRTLAATECAVQRLRLLRLAGNTEALLALGAELRAQRLAPRRAFQVALQIALVHLGNGDLAALAQETGLMRAAFPELDPLVSAWSTVLATPSRLEDDARAWSHHVAELAAVVRDVEDGRWAVGQAARIASARGLGERAAVLGALATG